MYMHNTSCHSHCHNLCHNPCHSPLTTMLTLLDMYASLARTTCCWHAGGKAGRSCQRPNVPSCSSGAAETPRMPRNEAHAKCKTFESGPGLGLTSEFNIVWIGLSSLLYHSSIMHARYSISFRMSECFVSDFTFVLWVWGWCGLSHAPIFGSSGK